MSDVTRAASRRRSRLAVSGLVAVAAAVLLVVLAAARFSGDDPVPPAVDDAPTATDEPGSDDPAPDDQTTDDQMPADQTPEEQEPGEPEPEPAPADDTTDPDADADDTSDERGRLVIHHVGDVSLDVRDIPVLGRGDLAGAWDGVRDTFAEAHLAIVNLECAATDGGTAQNKQFVFRCSLDALPHMRDAGVDVATIANNHSGDYGIQGMVDSIDNVEEAGIATVGVGRNEAEAYEPHIVEVEGWRVAILGFGGVVPVPEWTARGDNPGQATGYDAARMAEAVEAVADDVDLVVVTVHWGNEGAYTPRPEDVVKAERMIAAGADVVFGHHAHRLQPLEVVDEAPVFWNLGNFVWPRRSIEAATTAVAEYVVEPDGTVTSCLIPFEIDQDGVPRPTGAERDCQASSLR